MAETVISISRDAAFFKVLLSNIFRISWSQTTLVLWEFTTDSWKKNNKKNPFSFLWLSAVLQLILPFGSLILNSGTKQRVRLAGYEDNPCVALQPSYGEFWCQLLPTVWYKCLNAKLPVPPGLPVHGKSIPIFVTTLGAETFSRGTPEVFLNPHCRTNTV